MRAVVRSWALAAVLLPLVGPAVPAAAAPAAPALAPAGRVPALPRAVGDNCARPGQQTRTVPWPQQMLGPQRAWPLSTGAGVTVAVLDSGVDGHGQAQLRGTVTAGLDRLQAGTGGLVDCTGHGTQVAGIIAGRARTSVAFRGVAPDARLLSARISDADGGFGASAGTAGLAQAIDWAVGQHADVINVSLTTTTDDPAVAAAVARAVDADVIVVAAAGNSGGPNDGNPMEYPAAYPHVIAVGAVDITGALWNQSARRSFVDLVAPGVNLISTQTGGGLVGGLNGTSYAAAFVSGAAALVRARHRDWSRSQVTQQLYATATPAPAGQDAAGYGHGIVNLYGALADRMATGTPAALPALDRAGSDPAAAGRAAAWRRSTGLAGALAGLVLLLAVAVLFAARAVPLGRRRSWRAGTAPAVADDPEEDLVRPPVELFGD